MIYFLKLCYIRWASTIQTLALIVTDLATPEKPKRRTTLIVCPLALIRQWESELMGKAKQDIIKVYVHHGLGRTKGILRFFLFAFEELTIYGESKLLTPKSSRTPPDHAELLKYDVVITTYQVVASEYPESRARGRGKKKRQDEGGGDSSPAADDASGRPKKGRGPQPVQLGARPMVIDLDDGVGGEESGTGSGVESRATSPGAGIGAADSGSETPFSAAAGFGPLFRVHWYRIVLDEAQQIKNRNTRAALSCSALESEKRWCLTGTPLQVRNSILYYVIQQVLRESLIHFLRIKPFCDIQKFREQISKPMQSGQSDMALSRLKALLKAMMLRRTKHILKQNHTRMMEARNGGGSSEDQTMIETQEWNGNRLSESSSAIEDVDTDGDGGGENGAERGDVKVKMDVKVKVEGAPVTGTKSEEMAFLNLPSRNIEIIEAEFTKAERELYDQLNQKTKSTMNRMMKNGKLERNYLNILCLLLRLRQGIVRIHFILFGVCRFGCSAGDSIKETNFSSPACDHPQLVFKALSNDTDALEMETGQPGVGNATVSAANANRANATAAANHAMMMYVGAGLGWNLNGAAADQAVGSLSDVKNKKKCGVCLDTLSDPSATLCKDCSEKLLKPGNATAVTMDSSSPSGDNEDSAAATAVPAAAVLSPLLSTKIVKLLEVLEDTRVRFPGQKTIVFSQFTSMLDLLEEPLKKAEFRFCRYDGTMPNHLRERSIDMLKNDPDTTVMLISLKCGSLGYVGAMRAQLSAVTAVVRRQRLLVSFP
ncbi:P-loop containing nucleoside triphosphate hydrolase protein [Endogone sp. FLAS-F59071]|nr:P-loop containing nucleoside triphosphate hydrolase protein [Endogone sp. FLAS-F59071]|eukprot:RUS15876.1 P-loop containing nucleoside triphosphate hydrolase protein [Endogone sp. FLAS-F59071]